MSAGGLTKRDQIVDELRRLILRGDLARGARLPQDDLAKRFSTSITPVREAMRLLEAEGLVVSEPRRGVRVARVDLDRVTGIYVMRRLTESYAMRRAVDRMAPRDVAAAERLLCQMDACAAAGDSAALRDLNRQFHFMFYERCGLPSLCAEIASMWQAFPWDLMLTSRERLEESQREHEAILDAVRRGDHGTAAMVTETHIMHGYLSIAGHVSGRPVDDPFDPRAD